MLRSVRNYIIIYLYAYMNGYAVISENIIMLNIGFKNTYLYDRFNLIKNVHILIILNKVVDNIHNSPSTVYYIEITLLK